MADLLGYKSQLWKPVKSFEYTGHEEEFELSPGKYLLVCKGAPGGSISPSTSLPRYGGVSYGILTLDHKQTFYANVGGIGEDPPNKGEFGLGGWNGGGNGGLPYSASYVGGAGGGGASDIRTISRDEESFVAIPYQKIELPDEFEQLYFIQSTPNAHQTILTNYIAQWTDKFEIELMTLENSTYNSYEFIYGAKPNAYSSYAIELFTRYSGNNRIAYSRSNSETGITNTLNGLKLNIKSYKENIKIFNEDLKIKESNISYRDYNCNVPLMLFDCNNSNYKWCFHNDGSYSSATRLYGFKVYDENDNIKLNCVPVRYLPFEDFSKDVDLRECIVVGYWNNNSRYTSSSNKLCSQGFIGFEGHKFSINIVGKEDVKYQIKLHLATSSTTPASSASSIRRVVDWVDVGSIFEKEPNENCMNITIRHDDDSNISLDEIESVIITYYYSTKTGMYDTVSRTFFPAMNNEFEYSVDGESLNKSLLSRLIVAGGAGGAGSLNKITEYKTFDGFGGGVYGGCITAFIANLFEIPPYATQHSGYKFGEGQSVTVKKTSSIGYCAEGISGGGGGWFGGFTLRDPSNGNTSASGQGGSGYVYTDESFKFVDNVIDDDLKLTETLLLCGKSNKPEIIVYEQISTPKTGDVITFEDYGETTQMNLPMGEYVLECFGGDGGVMCNVLNTGRGGYARGVLTNTHQRDIFINVGGNGQCIGYHGASYFNEYNKSLGFNGAGIPIHDKQIGYCYGGGGTDIRLDVNDLNHRIIVAGGGGGSSSRSSNIGGKGGGLSGEEAQNNGSYGVAVGPGTQTGPSTPSTTNPEVNAGFGYGGNTSLPGNWSSGYSGGGGGGWYGGGGCTADYSGDDDKGASGGSGYVCTDVSFKPEDYAITNPEDFLSDTFMQTGGNNLPIGFSKATIKCNIVLSNRYIAYDEEGAKYYGKDATTGKDMWIPYSSDVPTIRDAKEKGVLSFASDEGLSDKYSIYVLSEEEYSTMELKASPPKDTIIRCKTNTNMIVTDTLYDFDYDNSVFDINVFRMGHGESSQIIADIIVHDKPIGEVLNMYAITLTSKLKGVGGDEGNMYIRPIDKDKEYEPDPESGVVKYFTKHEYRAGTQVMDPKTGRIYIVLANYTSISIQLDLRDGYIKPKPKYLLPVGSSSNDTSHYRTYLDTYEGAPITTIYASLTAIRQRTLYTLIDFSTDNGSTKFTRIVETNMFTGLTQLICDLPLNKLGNITHGGFLVNDKYCYISCATQASSSSEIYRTIYRVDLSNPSEIKPLVMGSSTNNNIFGYGKLLWKNDHTIVYASYNGLIEYDIDIDYPIFHQDSRYESRYDCAVNDKYFIKSYYSNGGYSRFYSFTDDKWFYFSDMSPKMASDDKMCCEYAHDLNQFIIVQRGYLTFIDGDTFTITKSIAAIWGEPETITYSDGVVFVVCVNSNIIYMYNINTNQFTGSTFKWTLPIYSSSFVIRPSSFRANMFMPFWEIYALTPVNNSKYNLGEKFNQYQLICDSSHIDDYEYDENFVTINNQFIQLHDSIISKPTEVVQSSSDGFLLKSDFDKKEYGKFINLSI